MENDKGKNAIDSLIGKQDYSRQTLEDLQTLDAAGLIAPPAAPSKFVAIGCKVMMGAECVCVARSNTMARRIARALFNHTPNERGV
jgi:hypothetical protein